MIRQFVFTTILMFTVPFIAFFAFKYLDCTRYRSFKWNSDLSKTLPFWSFNELFLTLYLFVDAGLPIIHLYVRDRNLVGGIGAIASVQLIMGYFLFKALTERDEREENPKFKKD